MPERDRPEHDPSSSFGHQAIQPLLELVPDAGMVVDHEGRILAANHGAGRLFGYPRLEGTQLDALVEHPAIHRIHRHRYLEAPQPRRMAGEGQPRGVRADGETFPVDVFLGPLDGGRYVIAVVRDASSPQARLEELREEVLHRQAVLEALFAGLAETDAAGRIVDVNDRFCRLVGASREELVGAEPPHRFWPEDIDPEHPGPTRTELRRLDGEPVEVLASLSALQVAGEQRQVMLVLDVSETAELEEHLHRSERRVAVLEDRERIARELHDQVIQRLLAAGMSLQALPSAELEQRAARRIGEVVTELDEVIRQIRAVIFDLGVEEDLPSAINRVVRETSRTARLQVSVRFEGVVPDDLPRELVLHAAAVVRELLSNVVRHARASRAEVVVDLRDHLEIRVVDDGRGLQEPAPSSGRGLRNVHRRAGMLGGAFRIGDAAEGGTVAEWRVPSPPDVT